MILKYLLDKEFRQIRRNAFLPRLILIFPVMIMCVTPWIMNMEVKNIVVDVVDNDRSTTSQRLVHRLQASDYFVFNGQKASYREALKDVEKSRADIIVVIPPRYERELVNGRNPQVLIAANAVDGTKGSMGAAYVSNVVIDGHPSAVFSTRSPFETLYLYNRNLNYKVFMIPALMTILVMLFCGYLPALNIVGEKEAGTIEQINVTPVSRYTFILSKLIPYWLISLLVMGICFLLSWLVYGIVPQGSILLLVFLSMLLAFVFSGIGLIVSNHSQTMQQAMFVIWFIVVCLMLLSGLFTPVRSMPDWAQRVSWFNPIHHYIDAMRTVFVRGGSFSDVAAQVSILSVFALVISWWAVQSYRKTG